MLQIGFDYKSKGAFRRSEQNQKTKWSQLKRMKILIYANVWRFSPPELKQENLRIYPPRRTAGIELSALQRWKYLTLKSDIVALYKIVPRFYSISL